MKRSIIKAFEEMESKLSGHVAVATYRYMQLCVKAEEMALLSVSFNIEGEEKYIEEVAKVAKPDDYTFIVIPNFDEDMPAIRNGISKYYPTFKQETGQNDVEVGNGEHDPQKIQVNYLKLTMPPVDEDRKKQLQEKVGKIYNECKDQMSQTLAAARATLTSLAESENQEVKDTVTRSLESSQKKWEAHRDKIYDEKKKEITEGHDKWMYENKQKKEK
jgi:ribosome recycling factor